MVKKMTGIGAVSANALAKEVGVSQGTLSRWKREASSVLDVSDDDNADAKTKPSREWTAADKLRAVAETEGMSEIELGAYLRRNGLHAHQLQEWKENALSVLEGGVRTKGSASSKRSPERRRIRQLEREVRRKDKALAEAAALLVLQKKLQALYEDEDDGTSETNDV